MLVELAIGDSYGAGFEYNEPEFVAQHNDLSGYVQHSGHPGVKPGRYTDDTQMTIAVAETLLGDDWSRSEFAYHFLHCFNRDRRVGYAGRFYNFLKSVENGREFLDRIEPRSERSGAAMRVSPVGLLKTEAEVVSIASLQARITHSTKNGQDSAVAAALAVHFFFRQNGRVADLLAYLERMVPGHRWAEPWDRPVGSSGIDNVRAAVTAVTTEKSLATILHRVVGLTGDVDTAGSIAMAIGSCSPEITNDLPPVLYQNLENGEFGRDYLAKLEELLLAKFGGRGG